MPSMAPLIGALPKLRQMAESLMTDQCVVTRPGATTTDPDTGLPNTGKEQVYEAAARCRPAAASPASRPKATRPKPWRRLVGLVFVRAFSIWHSSLRTGDVVEVTESANPLLAGRRLRLVSPQSEKTHATACRWNVKEDA